MTPADFMAAYERWIGARRVFLLRDGWTIRQSRSIGGALQQYVSGRLVAQ